MGGDLFFQFLPLEPRSHGLPNRFGLVLGVLLVMMPMTDI